MSAAENRTQAQSVLTEAIEQKSATTVEPAMRLLVGVCKQSLRTAEELAAKYGVTTVVMASSVIAKLIMEITPICSNLAELADYLGDWDVMSSVALPQHRDVRHRVWLAYRNFIHDGLPEIGLVEGTDSLVGAGLTDTESVLGVGYALTAIANLRMGVTEQTPSEFVDSLS